MGFVWAGGKTVLSRRNSIIKSVMVETSNAFAGPQGQLCGARLRVVVQREIVQL